MTLENLIKVVAEVVEKALLKQRLKVFSICFDWKNEHELRSNMENINSNGVLLFYQDSNLPKELPDIVFIDYIPNKYIPKIALGIADCPFSEFISALILNGKKIVVLSEDVINWELTPPAYRKMFSSYMAMISSYGFVFLDQMQPSNAQNIEVLGNETVFYSGNVLSKKDLYNYKSCSEIKVNSSVIITDLAKEEAKRLNIKISST